MAKKKVEAIHPLSPMQQAFLFHSLQQGSEDQGFLQVQAVVRGKLDPALFERAWERVVARHAVLRTSIHWEDLDRPLQVVRAEAPTPWRHEDWRDAPPDEQEGRLARFLQEDRAQGLAFTEAPLFRVALFRVEDEAHRLVWTCHHVLLDGWSSAVVLDEVLSTYEAVAAGKEPDLSPAVPYTTYLQWINRQDETHAEAFWRNALAGFATPTPLPFSHAAGRGEASALERRTFVLPADATARLRVFVRQRRMTVNTVAQGLWALLLARTSGRDDVVFGATTSGRTVPLPGVESMAGLFMNLLPVRARVEKDAGAADWLAALFERQQQARIFEYVPLARVQAWSETPGNRRLFDSLIVFENFPRERFRDPGRSLTIHDFHSGLTTTYPLTLAVRPGPSLELDLVYDRARFDADAVETLGDALVRALHRLPDAAEAPVETFFADLAHAPAAEEATALPASGAAYAPPRSELELELSRVWEDVFGTGPIGVEDDFFTLGGHSLLAVRLFAEIERRFDRALPMATLFERPTIAQQAELLDDDAWAPAWSSLVPIRPSGTRMPLFCIHAGGGEVLFYRALADRLGPDQPVYGLQALGLDGRREPLRRVEDMAARYLAEIRTVQPHGPYALTGRCFGDLVALEIAQRLHADGEQVALLAMIDSAPLLPSGVEGGENGSSRRYVLRLLEGGIWNAVRGTVAARVRPVKERLHREWVERFGDPRARYLRRVEDAIAEADAAYTLTPYAGRITLIRSTEYQERPEKAFHLETWTRIAGGGLDRYLIPVRHDTMFDEPEVEHLADRLAQCLAEAALQQS